jgi:hypothetical protein
MKHAEELVMFKNLRISTIRRPLLKLIMQDKNSLDSKNTANALLLLDKKDIEKKAKLKMLL